MNFLPGPFELLLLLLVGGVIVAVLFGIGRGSSSRTGRRGISFGHVTLACPHCKQETTAGKPQCEHCGKDL